MEVKPLNDLQLDLFSEIINLGIGQAAAALSEMVNEEIVLSVPTVTFVNKSDAVNMFSDNDLESVSSVSQNFNGPFHGKALLLFPINKSLELVRLMLQDTVPMNELTEFEEEALNEIGNIILNSGLSSMADLFGQEITSSLPVYHQDSCENIIKNSSSTDSEVLLFLHVAFYIETRKIDGYVVYLLDLQSLDSLKTHIDKYLKNMG